MVVEASDAYLASSTACPRAAIHRRSGVRVGALQVQASAGIRICGSQTVPVLQQHLAKHDNLRCYEPT